MHLSMASLVVYKRVSALFYKLFVFIIYLCELNELVDAIDISVKWHSRAEKDTFTKTDFPSAAIHGYMIISRRRQICRRKKNALTHFFHLFHFCTDEDKHSHTHTYTLTHMVWHVLNDFRVYIHVCTVHYQCHVLLFFIEKETIRYTHRRKTTTWKKQRLQNDEVLEKKN